MKLKKITDYLWEIPQSGAMLVPGLIYSSEKMIDHVIREKAAQQVADVASLPGIVGKSLAMPDVHWGYGFPIGGVAAFDIDKGVISPGGIGYDINCGVRLLRTNLRKNDIKGKIKEVINELFANIPSGVGSTGKLNLTASEVSAVLEKGAAWAVKKGCGELRDLQYTEEEGTLAGADPSAVSKRALERGREQLGTLGAGNHFLEVQVVDKIYDKNAAAVFGLFEGQVTVMIHTGSRGLGYQVCDDYIKYLQPAVQRYGIRIPDGQLVCAPVNSPEGRKYYSAMACAANYAWANRQIITHWVRESLARVLSLSPAEMGLEVVYDVAHNIGKREEHKGKAYLVHRKGATRAFPKGHLLVPESYRSCGQPVLVPGTMGTCSYVLTGTEKAMDDCWGSSCHGAGRVMSRTQALKGERGEDLALRLEDQGITVRADSMRTLAEEAPSAYKDVSEVADICEGSGIAKKTARMRPLGVIKG